MSSDESDDDIPDVAICQQLCEQFAEITGTDTACAQFYLQDRKWSLDRSVNDFFEDQKNKGAVRVNSKNEAEVILVVDNSASRLAAAATAVLAESATAAMSANPAPKVRPKTPESASAASSDPTSPNVLRFITWNIDGLNEKNLVLRTKAVIKIILNEKADVVFLQEVVSESAELLLKHLPQYDMLFGNENGYYVGTLLKKSTVTYSDFEIIDFPDTRMMRNALKVFATFKKQPLILYNSHLESTVDGEMQRKAQLQMVWKKIIAEPDKSTVIFAGDMNLRDKEVDELGGLPAGVEDMWIACGKRKECSYTWDMTRNDNLLFDGRFKPRCRFDRVMVRHASPRRLQPQHFGLIGLERLLPHRCFPSDHWGIHCFFEIEQ